MSPADCLQLVTVSVPILLTRTGLVGAEPSTAATEGKANDTVAAKVTVDDLDAARKESGRKQRYHG